MIIFGKTSDMLKMLFLNFKNGIKWKENANWENYIYLLGKKSDTNIGYFQG